MNVFYKIHNMYVFVYIKKLFSDIVWLSTCLRFCVCKEHKIKSKEYEVFRKYIIFYVFGFVVNADIA